MTDRNALLGTWKLQSYVVRTAAGQVSTPYGQHPTGYIAYSVDGRMQVIGAAEDRLAPPEPVATDDSRLALYDTMFAYGGTYSVEGDTVIHHVDISWNEIWTGTHQTRRFELDGNILTLTMHAVEPASGVEGEYSAVWEKVRPAAPPSG